MRLLLRKRLGERRMRGRSLPTKLLGRQDIEIGWFVGIFDPFFWVMPSRHGMLENKFNTKGISMFALHSRIGRSLVLPFSLCWLLGLSSCRLLPTQETAQVAAAPANSDDVGDLFMKKTGNVTGGTWTRLEVGHKDLRAFVHTSPKQRQHVAVARISKMNLSTLLPTSGKRSFPQEIAQKCPIAINGGYFFDDPAPYSISVMVTNSKIITPGIQNIPRSKGVCRPTRAAIGHDATGGWSFRWAKTFGSKVYSFENAPDPYSQYSESAGRPWDVDWAMGAGPMLVKNSKPVMTLAQECFEISAGSQLPRTAMAIAGDLMYFFVADGDTDAYDGFTIAQVRDMLVALGATDVISLDGGASSSFVVDGKRKNIPSISTRQIWSMLCLR